jgi:hypothetical protein
MGREVEEGGREEERDAMLSILGGLLQIFMATC